VQKERPRDHDREDHPPLALRTVVQPERQVEHDAGSARERKQGEDEPNEGDVDREGLRDPCADPRNHALIRGGPRQRHRGSW
jgi:hypothetical protein